jgi:gas vesicle protein
VIYGSKLSNLIPLKQLKPSQSSLLRHDILGIIVVFLTFKFFFMSKLLIGFTLGLAAGLLLAPEKGSDARRKLARAGKDLKNKFNDFVDGLQNDFEDMKDEAENFASDAKQTARSYSNQAQAGNSWGG